ncbi:MAG TPA: TonB-dependent receptor [Bacteroidales bacterium]|nr:TonB-dependent receptor [Bacteroidales bacterium]
MKAFLNIMFLLASLFMASSLQGQTLVGVVTDRETGQTLPGASVVVVGTTLGTITDPNGNYTLSLSPGDFTISFHFVGYRTAEIQVSLTQGETLIRNIDLQPEIHLFDEVVVIGYGTQQKRVVTGAISSVSAEEITATPILRVEQALQGRTPGVLVTNLSGQPGEAPTVRVRGAGTTGDAAPLFIVDGMAVGGIEFLNPNDIQSIEVLKDAASAAIYGARAANGVILITTKRPIRGEMTVSYSGYLGFQNVVRTIDLLDADQYRMMMNEGARNAGLPEPFNLNEIPAFNTNWQEALFVSNAPILNHNISVSGGSDRSSYFSSLSYFSQQGIIGGENSQFDRISARLNTSHRVNDFFNFGSNFSYTHTNQRGIASNTSFNGAFSSALNLDPLTPLFETRQNILAGAPYATEPVVRDENGNVFGISNLVGAEIVNPLAMMEIQTGDTRVDKLVGKVYGELNLLPGLIFNSNVAIDMAYLIYDDHDPLFFLNHAQRNTERTAVSKTINRWFTWQWENTLSWNRSINDHNISALAGVSARKLNFENLYGFNSRVPITDPRHVYLNMAMDTMWVATGGANHHALLSQFARVMYDYKRRYAITAIIRRDGSSRFGPENRFGIFPSLGVSWVISDEAFFPEINNLDILRIRASWGINGNENIGDFQFISTINQSRGYIFGGGRSVGSSPSYMENLEIRWEQSEMLDIGIEFGAFNNRMTGVLNFYEKTTGGLLERVPIPAHVGNDPPFANVGSVQNRGVEFSLDWRNYTPNFSYSMGINASFNQNRITHIGNEQGVLPGATWAIAGMITRGQVGMPIGFFWGYQTNGLFQNQADIFRHVNRAGHMLQPNAVPGDVRFVDVNGDGVISPDDRTKIGNPIPDWTFGYNASFRYRNFDLSFLVIGTLGNDIFNGMIRQDLRFTNRTTEILERWTGEGTSNSIPRFTWIDANHNYRVSDLYVEDGSFLRMRNIQIGYNIPSGVLQNLQATNWRIYVSVENLFTLTRYSGADPEIGAMSPFNAGIDRGIYPHARTFRIGTTISF